MADPIKYGWLPDKQYDPKLKRELYGWRNSLDDFIPNEQARIHYQRLKERENRPFTSYDEYAESMGIQRGSRFPLPAADDDRRWAQRYREMFPHQSKMPELPRGEAKPAQPPFPPGEAKPYSEPFTQADNLRLQRINQNLAALASQVNEGRLYPQEAAGPQQELVAERQELLARQEAAAREEQGKQRMRAMDEMAFQQSAMIQNQMALANKFADMVPRVQDPDTGRTTYFAPQGYQQIDYGEVQPNDIADILFGQGETDAPNA